MRAFAWVAIEAVASCAGLEVPETGVITGRITTSRGRPEPDEFTFMDRAYVDRSLRVDGAGGVADAAVFLEGRETAPWVSGKVAMTFGANQFEPRVAFVSPGEPVEIGDTRDEMGHELVVNLKGLTSGEARVHTDPSRPTKSGKPDRVCFECNDGTWTAVGKRISRGRTKELTFNRPVMVPLDWD